MTKQVQQELSGAAQAAIAGNVRYYVWFNDPNDPPGDEDFEKRGPFFNLPDAQKYADRRALDGFIVNIESATPLKKALEKGSDPFYRCYLEASREISKRKMKEAGHSSESIDKESRRAKTFGIHYGRTLGFTAVDAWAKFEGIDPHSTQELIDSGWDRFTIELAESYADQSFWVSRLKKLQRELAAEVAKDEAGQ